MRHSLLNRPTVMKLALTFFESLLIVSEDLLVTLESEKLAMLEDGV